MMYKISIINNNKMHEQTPIYLIDDFKAWSFVSKFDASKHAKNRDQKNACMGAWLD